MQFAHASSASSAPERLGGDAALPSRRLSRHSKATGDWSDARKEKAATGLTTTGVGAAVNAATGGVVSTMNDRESLTTSPIARTSNLYFPSRRSLLRGTKSSTRVNYARSREAKSPSIKEK